jgi:hypothetical protein
MSAVASSTRDGLAADASGLRHLVLGSLLDDANQKGGPAGFESAFHASMDQIMDCCKTCGLPEPVGLS